MLGGGGEDWDLILTSHYAWSEEKTVYQEMEMAKPRLDYTVLFGLLGSISQDSFDINKALIISKVHPFIAIGCM